MKFIKSLLEIQLLVPDDWDLTLTHSVPENTRSYMDSRASKPTLPVHDHPLGQKPVVLLVLLERLGDGGGDGAANLHVGLVEVTAGGRCPMLTSEFCSRVRVVKAV